MRDKSENMTSARITQFFRNEITEEIFHTEADVINMTGKKSITSFSFTLCNDSKKEEYH